MKKLLAALLLLSIPAWAAGPTSPSASGCGSPLSPNISCGGGGGSLPSGNTGNLVGYTATGTTGAAITLGTNLSMTGSTLNATGGGSSTLGTSSSVTSPSKSGDATTGLFSNAAGTVSVSSAGTDALDVKATGLNINTPLFTSNSQKIIQLDTNSTGNVFIGNNNAQGTVTGGENVAVGDSALQFITTGVFDTAIGQHAGGFTVGEYANTFVGNDNCRNCVGGGGNTTLGKSAMATGGQTNSTVLGFASMPGNALSITLGGTLTTGDVLSLNFTAPSPTNYYGGAALNQTVTYTILNTDTLATAIVGLQSAINANTTITNFAASQGTAQINGVSNGAPYTIQMVLNGTCTNSNGGAVCATASVSGSSCNATTGVCGSKTETILIGGGDTGYENIAIGYSAMNGYRMTTAPGNIAIGKHVLDNLTTANSNIGIGWFGTLQNVTTGSQNIALGPNTGLNLTTGYQNVLIGPYVASTTQATGGGNIMLGVDNSTDSATASTSNAIIIGQSAHGGTGDIAIGYNALHSTTSDSLANTAIGYNALTSNTSGNSNFALGYGALGRATTANGNLAIGFNALSFVTTGGGNVDIGGQSANLNTGANNVFVGSGIANGNGNTLSGNWNLVAGTNSCGNLTGGAGFNTVLGGASCAITTGNYNTSVGGQTFSALTTGSNNTSLGYNVGQTNESGAASNDILIGTTNGCDVSGAGNSNETHICGANGDSIFIAGTNATSTEKVTIYGNVGLGTTTPKVSLDLGSKTDSLLLPTGTTGQRPTATAGMIRYNTDTPAVEAYYSGAWNSLGGGGGGPAAAGTLTGTTLASNVVSSSLTSVGTLTGLSISGTETITSTATAAVSVGRNGATNPVLQVNDSTASQASGLMLTGDVTGGTTALTVTDSGANSNLSISTKGTGNLTLTSNNLSWGTASNSNLFYTAGSGIQFNFKPIAEASTATPKFIFTAPTGEVSLTASQEALMEKFDNGALRYHGTGALALQRDFLVLGSVDAFLGASTLTNGATMAIGYKDCSTNATCTNESGLLIQSSTFSGTVTNGYGINIAAPAGATNNYAARFAGDVVFAGTAPTISSCGSGSLASGSTDHKGQITGITAATACTITFGQGPLGAAPACTFSNSAGTAVGISAISTTAVTTTMTALTGTLYYICF